MNGAGPAAALPRRAAGSVTRSAPDLRDEAEGVPLGPAARSAQRCDPRRRAFAHDPRSRRSCAARLAPQERPRPYHQVAGELRSRGRGGLLRSELVKLRACRSPAPSVSCRRLPRRELLFHLRPPKISRMNPTTTIRLAIVRLEVNVFWAKLRRYHRDGRADQCPGRVHVARCLFRVPIVELERARPRDPFEAPPGRTR